MIKENDKMWFDKYRPETMDEFVCDNKLRRKMKNYLNDNPTHLLLHGKAGSGKTSLSKIIINELDCEYMIINASMENGIDTCRNKLMGFVTSMSMRPRKVVLMDEFDGFSTDGQNSLRNLMEKWTNRVVFIMTCNHIDKITEAIKSRCYKHHLKSPKIKMVYDRCRYILNEEDVDYDDVTLCKNINMSYPDLRRTVTNLQTHSIMGDKHKVLEVMDIEDCEGDRCEKYKRFDRLASRMEWNSEMIWKILPEEQEELVQLIEEDQFLITGC